MEIRLTQFTKGGGCGCKIPPGMLSEILSGQLRSTEFGLIVGNSGGDDAAVWDLGNEQCLISTTDFFTPIVDNPFDFGRIAAANAISDIYAMGGKPILALSILAWPTDDLPLELAAEVLRGANSICAEAGIAIGGGHSIVNPEPVFGLAVNGLIRKENIKRNNTASAGDTLILTKPLGSGMLTTAMKRDLLDQKSIDYVVDQLVKLNAIGERLSSIQGVHAMTDVTGFGLIGHLLEMVREMGLTAEINYGSVPLMDGVKELASKFIYPNNTMRNWKSFSEQVEGVSGESLLTLCDPQTNGGLLLAVSQTAKQEVFELLTEKKQFGVEIGKLIPFKTKSVHLI